MENRHAAYSLAYKMGANFLGHFGGKNPCLIAEEIRYQFIIWTKFYYQSFIALLNAGVKGESGKNPFHFVIL